MKVLIWCLCFFANALITTILKQSGIMLGGIPTMLLFAGTIALARILCKNWDNRKKIKKEEKSKEEITENLDSTDKSLTASKNSEDYSSDELVNSILEFQAEQTIKVMNANESNQPNNENDDDFGLIPKKPIYTLALKSVNGEKEYLNKLYTSNGEKLTYNRRGSMSAEGINGMIDIYDTFLPSGELYKTIYINMYGAYESSKAPNGFVFYSDIIKPDDNVDTSNEDEIITISQEENNAKTKTCYHCGKEVSENSSFCRFCGKNLKQRTRYCRKCGTKVLIDSVFCEHCGTKISVTTAFRRKQL